MASSSAPASLSCLNQSVTFDYKTPKYGSSYRPGVSGKVVGVLVKVDSPWPSYDSTTTHVLLADKEYSEYVSGLSYDTLTKIRGGYVRRKNRRNRTRKNSRKH